VYFTGNCRECNYEMLTKKNRRQIARPQLGGGNIYTCFKLVLRESLSLRSRQTGFVTQRAGSSQRRILPGNWRYKYIFIKTNQYHNKGVHNKKYSLFSFSSCIILRTKSKHSYRRTELSKRKQRIISWLKRSYRSFI
jgi:hypothetical protein